jgi:hypothetical protein
MGVPEIASSFGLIAGLVILTPLMVATDIGLVGVRLWVTAAAG